MASDTTVEEWKLVENPNTGIMEMRLVRKVRTTVSTSSSSNRVILPSPPETSSTKNKGLHTRSDVDDYRMILTISSLVLAVITLYIVSK